MKKVFKMKNVDCANCAAKMEKGICKIEGVESATLNFMSQRLTIEAEESAFDRILDLAEEVCRKVDREVEIVR